VTRIAPQPWMEEPPTRALLDALAQAGIRARFVGGCVRDALLGQGPIADIDLATPARPEEVAAALDKAGIKVVPTGIVHGTVTAIVDFPGVNLGSSVAGPPRHFEITTLRRDVETDGRHARVAFDADWAEDAARRDFTINAIYLDPDGTVHDPVGGLADLAARRVRFVGDAARRIAEDVLRVLRYYRFEARFGDGDGKGPGSDGGDPAARAGCRASVKLLPKLSAERVAQELLRLLAVANPVPALRMMKEDGVLGVILPEATRLDRLERLITLEAPTRPLRGLPPQQAGEGWGGRSPDPIRRLAGLVDADAAGVAAVAGRLRLSNAERDRLVGLAPPWPLDPAGDDRVQHLALYRLGEERFRDLVFLIAADGRIGAARRQKLLDLAGSWRPPAFPLAGRDVTALGIPPGPRIGYLLGAVRRWWEAGDFTADRAACLEKLKEIAAGSPDRTG
jgi:poly(A) polymerase